MAADGTALAIGVLAADMGVPGPTCPRDCTYPMGVVGCVGIKGPPCGVPSLPSGVLGPIERGVPGKELVPSKPLGVPLATQLATLLASSPYTVSSSGSYVGVGDSMPGKRMPPAGLADNEYPNGVDGCTVEGVPREAGVDGPLWGVPVAGISFGVALAIHSAILVSSAKSSSSASSVGVGGSFSSTNVGELPAEYVGVGGNGISRPSSRYVGELASGSTLGPCPTGLRRALAMAISCGVAGSAKNSVGE